MNQRDLAVIVPFYQKSPGVLASAINSISRQTLAGRIEVIVVDDGSPSPIESEKLDISNSNIALRVIKQPNGGAGAARNKGLDNVSHEAIYVAFLDSDDVWEPSHIENAVSSLERGYDFYFSDYIACNDKDQTNFERIGSLRNNDHPLVDQDLMLYELRGGIVDHVIRQGNVIGTSNVVYRYAAYPKLRFREEFYNGQDFFFWMDLGELGARSVFSKRLECHCGSGINIYSGAGWGSERSLQRFYNELKIWIMADRIYSLTSDQVEVNTKRIRELEDYVTRDILHRLLRRSSISASLLVKIARLSPGIIYRAPINALRAFIGKLLDR